MYIHFCKCIYTYVHGMYMVCTFLGINVYVHRSDMYVHVYSTSYDVRVLNHINMYIQCILCVV